MNLLSHEFFCPNEFEKPDPTAWPGYAVHSSFVTGSSDCEKYRYPVLRQPSLSCDWKNIRMPLKKDWEFNPIPGPMVHCHQMLTVRHFLRKISWSLGIFSQLKYTTLNRIWALVECIESLDLLQNKTPSITNQSNLKFRGTCPKLETSEDKHKMFEHAPRTKKSPLLILGAWVITYGTLTQE